MLSITGGGSINENLDHTTIVCRDDATLLDFLQKEEQRHYVVPFNTTAENIAVHLKEQLQHVIDSGLGVPLTVVSITLMETPDSHVETS